jgi:polysaccharide chain length determinant protein (PEP-CTERM system associated)
MEDTKSLIVVWLRRMWRRRWVGVAVAWLVCLGGWLGVSAMPDKYNATARIYVDTDSLLTPLLKGIAISPNINDQIKVIQQTLLSGPNIAQVIRMADLDLGIASDAQMDLLITRTLENIKVSASGRNLFTINYENTDPKVAQRVVQSLLTIFVENNVGENRQEMETARAFLEGQIVDYERQLQAAEKRLADFRAENGQFLSREGSYVAKAENMQAQVREARTAYEDALLTRDQLRNQLAAVPQYLEVESAPQVVLNNGSRAVDPAVASLQSRINELQRNLDGMLLKYTEQHPDVIAVRRTLDALTGQLKTEQERVASQATGGGDGGGRANTQRIPNAIYEQLKLRLVDAESNAAKAERRVEKLREQLAQIEGMAQKAPQIEAALANLNRDYSIIKRNYEQLLARRESAKIAQAVDAETDIQFRIIDPPKTPTQPTAPNRPLMLSLVLAAGLGVGGGFIFLLIQLDTSFANTSSLRQAFGLPVLGAVTQIVNSGRTRLRLAEIGGFGSVCAVLVAIYGALVVLEPRVNLSAIMLQVENLL